MPTARFQANFSQSAIDAEKGIIAGVKIMEKGRVASFADAEGNPKEVTIQDAHIKRLMSFAGNRAIVSHLTHEWHDATGKENADSIEMGARVGAFKNFRRDGNGDLIADYFLKDGPHKSDILWGAENTPDDNMVSVVFSYDKNDPLCMPLDFEAADLVPNGAATTALFKQTNPKALMAAITLDDLKELLSTPEGKAMVQGCIDGHDDATKMSDDDAAEMEDAAGVDKEDKKDEDKQRPALMRVLVRQSRTIARLRKSLVSTSTTATLSDAAKAELKTIAQAAMTEVLGKNPILKTLESANTDEYTATLAEYKKTAPTEQMAVYRMLKDKPELYAAHEVHTRARMAKLKPSSPATL